ncbi:MAG: SIMPL domain-containing protein [Ginsengibacter sp.]
MSVEDQEIKMVTFLKSSGIEPEKDLTINDMTSNFRFYLLQNRDILKTKQYMLKVNDAVTVSKVFIGLEDIGISNASIERVDHSDLENIKNLMRSKAIENAKGKALAMTKPLNQKIAAAIYIADNENYNANNTLQGRAEGVIVTGYGETQKSKQGIPKIDFEKIRAAANINVKFLLKDSLL